MDTNLCPKPELSLHIQVISQTVQCKICPIISHYSENLKVSLLRATESLKLKVVSELRDKCVRELLPSICCLLCLLNKHLLRNGVISLQWRVWFAVAPNEKGLIFLECSGKLGQMRLCAGKLLYHKREMAKTKTQQ